MAHWSRLRKLTAAWSLFTFLFISSAAVLIIVAQIWRIQGGKLDTHTLRTLVIGSMDLTAATVLGAMIALAAVIGVIGFSLGLGKGKGDNTMGLVVFNWALIFTTVSTIIIGSIIWFYSLTQREDYRIVWLAQNSETMAFLQDTLQCCGYFNSTSNGLFTQSTGFCAGPITNVTAIRGCVTPITDFSDYLLNNVFTTIYGFTAVEVTLFLTTCCLIISRREEERFRRIDNKMGSKGGFV